jgi:DNA-binding NarL/FixJ family response regulator
VKFHLQNIFTKLGVQDRTQATAVAFQRGIVRLDD